MTAYIQLSYADLAFAAVFLILNAVFSLVLNLALNASC